MGVAIPQVLTEDRVSGAQVIDGSLKFDKTKTQYLRRTISTPTSANTWTFSCWIKRNSISYSEYQTIFSYDSTASRALAITATIDGNPDCFYIYDGTSINVGTARKVRDASSWYHLVLRCSSGTGTLYLNGESSPYITAGATMPNMSNGQTMGIGLLVHTSVLPLDAQLSQVYFIDGQALDPSYFGFTDPLTNTWRPKKLSSSVAFGTNGFYLPFDGSAPIGQDQSGRGNNWTPVNFGGSNTLEKATGALPILNTDGGGKVARVGTRTDENASDIVLALPLVGNKEDVSAIVKGSGSNKTVTSVNAVASSAQSNFYGGSYYFDGSGDYLNAGTSTDFVFGTGQFTIEGWVYNQSYNGSNGGTGDSYPSIISAFSGGTVNWIWRIYRTGALTWYNPSGGGTNNNSADGLTQLNTWYHVAYVREGTGANQFKMYLNGILVHTLTDSNDYTANETVVIGSQSASNPRNYHTGYLQDLRIYKGLAKYTQNFIPASTDPDILPDTPSGVSYSSNVALVPSTDGAVAFDGSGDYLSLGSSADFAFGTGDFTIEVFVYKDSADGDAAIFDLGSTNTSGSFAIVWDGGTLTVRIDGLGNDLSTTEAPSNKWIHVAVARSGSTLRLFVDGDLKASGTRSNNITQSTPYIGDLNLFDYDFTGFLSNFHIVKGTALYTSNFTPPSAPLTAVQNTKLLCCKSQTSATAFDVVPTSGINNGTFWSANVSTSVGTIVDAPLAFNGSTSSGDAYASSTASDTYIYIDFSSPLSGQFKLWTGMSSGSRTATVTHSGGTSVVNLSSGENTLGTFTSVTRIAVNRGEASTHSFRAISVDETVLTDPIIPNGNTAATNFNPFTVNINTQRGKQSGYCTLNPLAVVGGATYSNGNLKVTGSAAFRSTPSTITMSVGKWYVEYFFDTWVNDSHVGVMNNISPSITGTWAGSTPNGFAWAGASGDLWTNGGLYNSSFDVSFTTGDTCQIAFDADNGNMYFGKNGIWLKGANPSAGTGANWTGLTNGPYYPYVTTTNGTICSANFGQKPFKFPPPAGFQPLALANTPRPSIVRPDQYMGVVTYTGNGGTQTISGLNFSPDLVWIKNRGVAHNHAIYDVQRGAYVQMQTNLTAEDQNFNPYGVTAFNSDGFGLNDLSNGGYNVNGSSMSYVAWTWKAGGNSNTFNIDDVGYDTASAAGLTAGTITPTGASVNTKSGFSIISWTANGSVSTLSHGLGAKPKFVINKPRTGTYDWAVITDMVSGSLQYLYLNSTQTINNTGWGTNPTSSVMSVYSYSVGLPMISYCWAEIPGFSKFGTYTGNGTADNGTFVSLGFRPALILIKRTTSGTGGFNWTINDKERNKYNPSDTAVFPNLSNVESTNDEYEIDFLSNGFKLRSNVPDSLNVSGQTYIYAAWAETPSFNLYGGQANAR